MEAIIKSTDSKKGVKKLLFLMLLLCVTTAATATDYYASPTGTGTGLSYSTPMSLLAAFSTTSPISAGDKLFLKGGTYTGRFICNLKGQAGKKITVTSAPGEWAILNGNILPLTSTDRQVLKVKGAYVIFKDFEVTYKNVLRSNTSVNYTTCSGIYHGEGIDCEFINLRIHDNPGIGLESWKEVGASIIYGCMIYNNGYVTPTPSIPNDRERHGPGLYIQNRDTRYKIFKNNIVFNNFYIGFEAYSDSPAAGFSYVQYLTFDDNTVFNNGEPASTNGYGDSNITVKSLDATGSNIINHINIVNNTVYHNTNFTGHNTAGTPASDNSFEARALEVGNVTTTYPSQDILIDNNFLSGRNPTVKLNDIETLTFINNYVLGRFVEINHSNKIAGRINATGWHFDNNKYFTGNGTYLSHPGIWGHKVFRLSYPCGSITCLEDYWLPSNLATYAASYPVPPFPTWKQTFPGLDVNSTYSFFSLYYNAIAPWSGNPFFYANPPKVLKVTQNIYKPNQFTVVLLNPPTTVEATTYSDIPVNFSGYNIPSGTPYVIKDVENFPNIAASGTYTGVPVNFNTNLTTLSAPLGSDYTNNTEKTPGNFGVFLIEFADFSGCETDKIVTTDVQTGNFDFQQASATVTASNIVKEQAIGLYHAGTRVILKNGFHAKKDSNFRAYIAGCTQTFSAKQANVQEDYTHLIKASKLVDKPVAEPIADVFSIYPNPTSGIFTIESKGSRKITSVSVVNINDKKEVANGIYKREKAVNIDISKEKLGLYTVQLILDDGKLYSKTIIKK